MRAPCACSGGRYRAVPTTAWVCPVWAEVSDSARAIPKSITLTAPDWETITLAGFTSRWTTPCACA